MTSDPKEFLKLLDSFERLSPIDYPWGSSQYDSIASTFRILNAMRATPIQGARLMGATLHYHRNSSDVATRKAVKVLRESWVYEDPPTDERVQEMLSHHRNSQLFKDGKLWEARLKVFKNPELLSKDGDLFLLWTREAAWDLWHAIPTITEAYFGTTLTSLFPESDEQNFENNRLGLLAYLLFYEGIVKHEESFKGFAT